MLSNVESFFIRLLRGTVIATAFVSILVTVLALAYAAYAEFSPEPTVKLSAHVAEIRDAVDPARLMKEVFPPGMDISKEAAVTSAQNFPYEQKKRFDDEFFAEFNKFLEAAFGGSFDSPKTFNDWLYGQSAVRLHWSRSIDIREANNEDSAQLLWRSVFYDYAKRLTTLGPFVANARKSKALESSVNMLTEPTPPSRAPYFVTWYFAKLQVEMDRIAAEFDAAKSQRSALKLTAPFALSVAAGAFSYFIFIMFLFLLVSIEASVRYMASAASGASFASDNLVGSHDRTVADSVEKPAS